MRRRGRGSGALVHVRLEPADEGTGVAPEVWGPEQVGERGRWSEVGEGAWRVVGSTRVCNGSCDDVGGPVDTCVLDLDVTADTTVVVTYRWGEPCRVELD